MAINFGIPQLRQNALMNDWGAPVNTGYDWSAPMVDYGAGDMPASNVGMNMPPPSVGPVQDTPPAGMFGREYTPSMTGAQPTSGAPPAQIAPPAVNTYDPDRANRDMMSAIGKVFTPEHIDRDRLRALMDAAPEREAPGWGRGLSAIALGLGSKDPAAGLAAQETVMFAPHRRAMTDWAARTEPFAKTAELENRENVNERTLAGNVVKSVSEDRRLEQQRVRDEGKQAVAEERNRINEITARAREAREARWTVKIDGDRVIATSPDGKQMQTIGSSRGMSTEDKINLEGRYKVAAAAEAAKGAQTRAEISQTREFTDKEGRTWTLKGDTAEPTNLPPGSVPSAAPRGAGGGELEKDRVEQNKLQGLYEASSANREHITVGTNGKYQMRKRPEPSEGNYFGWGKVDQAKADAWDAVKKQVDPTYVPPVKAATPKEAKPVAPKVSFPEVKVKPESTTGLGPSNVPKIGSHVTAGTPMPGAGAGYKTQTDSNNPNNKRRSADGGKTWEISHDGGRTWNRGG